MYGHHKNYSTPDSKPETDILIAIGSITALEQFKIHLFLCKCNCVICTQKIFLGKEDENVLRFVLLHEMS